jgi:hypothetical protein
VVLVVIGLVWAGSYPMGGLTLISAAVAVVIGRLFVVPNSVTAWGTGAEGEVRTALRLAELGPDYVVIHDRRIPGTKANIDHIVVGPPGIFVVETKSLRGRLSIRGQDVYVDGRRKTAMIEEVRRERLAVRIALGDDYDDVPFYAAICVHRADLPLFKSSVGDVAIVSGKGLVGLIRKARYALDEDDVDDIAELLEERLKPALRKPDPTIGTGG